MKFKVFKSPTTPEEQEQGINQTLEYQLEVADADGAVDYVLANVPHQASEAGITPIPDSDGVHLTKWLRLDWKDTYWFIPGGRFKKQPTPIAVGGGK